MSLKAVVLAAGRGSRLCPLTPFIPKEMLPVEGLPVIHHVLTELASAGVKKVLVVLSEGKEVIRDYLTLRMIPKGEEAERLSVERERTLSALDISFAMQKELLGTAHAISLASSFMGDDNLLVAYPDDLMYDPSSHGVIYEPTRKIIELSAQTGNSVVLADEIEGRDALNYGVLRLCARDEVSCVKDIVEKPLDYREDKAHILIGRMMITPRVMESIPRHRLTDGEGIIPALREEAAKGRLSALVYKGNRFDLGSHQGYKELLRRTLNE